MRTPDPNGNLATFYIDGAPQPAWIAPMYAQPIYPGEAHATLAGRRHSGTLANGYAGSMDEVRIWRTCRTREQILDNMFGRLRGETKDMVAYFPFDGASTQAGATVKDSGPRGNDLSPSPDAPRNVISSAPISADAAEVRSALTGIGSTFNARIDAPPPPPSTETCKPTPTDVRSAS
ncbi:hypothetical protein [Embleya sp. NPDC020630]|uniref:hypothetical protein n=1 Tax=Embleya sp. NPDC020630 TaxID=3363979 RepID=UPI00378E2568